MRDMSKTAPYARGNEASTRAAAQVQHQLTGARAEVFEFIVARGTEGATSDEIVAATARLVYTVKPRCTELKDAGYIADSGKLRANRNGNPETVWVALPEWPTGPWIPPLRLEPAADGPSGLAIFDDVLRRNPHLKNTIGFSNVAIIRGDLAIVAGGDHD